MVENTIITTLIEAIKSDDDLSATLKLIGTYPYDTAKVIMNSPAILFKLGDIEVENKGHGNYHYTYNTLILLYVNSGLSTVLTILDKLIPIIYSTINNMNCYRLTTTINILSGDINLYLTPSDTGYNANIIVRKLTMNYTINKILF